MLWVQGVHGDVEFSKTLCSGLDDGCGLGSTGSAGSGNPALSGCGSRFGELELSGEDRRHAGEAAGAEYRSAGTALLPGGQGERGRDGDDCRAGRRFSDADDVV